MLKEGASDIFFGTGLPGLVRVAKSRYQETGY